LGGGWDPDWFALTVTDKEVAITRGDLEQGWGRNLQIMCKTAAETPATEKPTAQLPTTKAPAAVDGGWRQVVPITETGKPVTIMADKECTDANVACPDWASAGECTKNAQYMQASCCKACSAEGGNEKLKAAPRRGVRMTSPGETGTEKPATTTSGLFDWLLSTNKAAEEKASERQTKVADSKPPKAKVAAANKLDAKAAAVVPEATKMAAESSSLLKVAAETPGPKKVAEETPGAEKAATGGAKKAVEEKLRAKKAVEGKPGAKMSAVDEKEATVAGAGVKTWKGTTWPNAVHAEAAAKSQQNPVSHHEGLSPVAAPAKHDANPAAVRTTAKAAHQGHAHACTFHSGRDYTGNDISQVQAAMKGDCCARCAEVPECTHFVHDVHGGRCLLKSGTSDVFKATGDERVTGGVCYTYPSPKEAAAKQREFDKAEQSAIKARRHTSFTV